MDIVNEYSPEKMCRVCANFSRNLVSLFESNSSLFDTTPADFLSKITNLEITNIDDNMPKVLCTECLDKVNHCSELIQNCINSDLVLRQVIETIQNDSCCDNSPELDLDDKVETIQEITQNHSKYQCQSCGVNFSNKRKFTIHQRIHEEYSFKCDECWQTFSKKIHLKAHLRSHIPPDKKKHGCSKCGKQFSHEYLLKQHKFKHSDEKPFPCEKCGRGCLTVQSLRRHMKIHEESYLTKTHICKVCSKEFAYPSVLAEHMKNHTGEKPHLCSFCGKGFRQSGGLHYHQRLHTGYKPFTCKVCNGDFHSRSVLRVHMRKHTNERPYVCHICGVAFRQSTDLKGHQRTHSGDKPALCTICGKRMSTTGQLTVHLRSHTGEKPYACSTCPKAFTTKTTLVKHERIHTGERPYICDICGRAFNQSGSLKTHKNTHNNENRRVKKSFNELLLVRNVEENHDQGNHCDVTIFKNDEIETEIITEQIIQVEGEEVEDKCQNSDLSTHFTVISPAPIPLVHNL